MATGFNCGSCYRSSSKHDVLELCLSLLLHDLLLTPPLLKGFLRIVAATGTVSCGSRSGNLCTQRPPVRRRGKVSASHRAVMYFSARLFSGPPASRKLASSSSYSSSASPVSVFFSAAGSATSPGFPSSLRLRLLLLGGFHSSFCGCELKAASPSGGLVLLQSSEVVCCIFLSQSDVFLGCGKRRFPPGCVSFVRVWW